MRYTVTHQTTYDYASAVSVSHHFARLTPRDTEYQHCHQHELRVEPSPSLESMRVDYFGNPTTFLTVEGAHSELTVTASSQVELVPRYSPAPGETPAWESVRELFLGDRLLSEFEAGEFAFDSAIIQRRSEFAEYARVSFPRQKPVLEAVLDLTRRIHAEYKFDPKATTVATPLEQVFRQKGGVCQDFAQLEIACLRSLGLPARYVSGYLETIPPPGKPKLVGADASHAWLSFFCPEFGWIDVDPTNNVLPSERHITLAWGRDFSDVSPLRGVIVGGGKHLMKVAVDVLPG